MIRVFLMLFVMLILAGGSIAVIKSVTQRNQAEKPDYDNIARLEQELLGPQMLEYDMAGRPMMDDPYQQYLHERVQLAKAQKELKQIQEEKEKLLRLVKGGGPRYAPYHVKTIDHPDGFAENYYTWTDPKTGATMGRKEVVYDPLRRPARYYDPGYG